VNYDIIAGMATYLKDVQPGDQLIITNKLGLALALGRYKDGSGYRYVPNRRRVAKDLDLVKYFGLVQANNPDAQLLTLSITPMLITDQTHQYETRGTLPGVVHYSALRDVLRLSPTHLEPHTEESVHRTGYGPRPTTKAIGTAFKPYRTMERIRIT